MFHMLGKARVGPSFIFCGRHVFIMAGVEATGSFSDVRLIAVGTIILVDTFTLQRVGLCFVSGAKCRLKFLAGPNEGVASCPMEGAFKFVCSSES